MRPFHSNRLAKAFSSLHAKSTHFSRLHLRCTRITEFLLSHALLYWLLTAVFLILCLYPLAALLFTKVYPAPTVLWTLLTGAAGLPVLLGAIYMLRPIPPSPGWCFTQDPLSPLAEADVVMVDTALITGNKRCVGMLAQPFDPVEPKKGPGMLSLAAAITYTADRYDAPEAEALLHAADMLGLNRSNLLRFRPIEGETQLGHLPGVVVRDGKRRMAYFTGGAGDLSDLCGGVLDGTIRPMTEEDRIRIRHAMLEMSQRGCRVAGYACSDDTAEVAAPIFLGMAALQDYVFDDAAQAVEALRSEGITLLIQPVSKDALPPYSLSGLRQRLRCTDEPYNPQIVFSAEPLDTLVPCISPVDDRHRGFHSPVLLAREWFGDMEIWLRTALTAALPLLMACAAGPADPLWCLAIFAMLLCSLSTASSRCRPGIRGLMLPLLVAGAARLFLGITLPDAVGPAMALYTCTACGVTVLHLPGKWQTMLITIGLILVLLPLSWLVPGLELLHGCFALVAGILGGLLAGRSLRP